MIKYIGKRLLWLVPVLLGMSLLVFVMQALAPGDPADLILGDYVSAEKKAEWRTEYGLDDPLPVQYGKYVWGIVSRGDFGRSYQTGKPVTDELMARWPVTLATAFMSTTVAAIIGVLLGIISALNRNKWIDSVARVLGIVGVSVPHFWLALLMIMLFAVKLRWFPVSGFYGPEYWILPMMTMGLHGAAQQMRYTRSAMLDNIQQDFVRTARAKGQKESVVVRHHILRNAMISIITNIGTQFGKGMAGTVVIEQIFAISGLGTLLINAVNIRDYPQMRGCILLIAFAMAIVNLIVDLVYAAVDPRIRARFKSKKKAG